MTAYPLPPGSRRKGDGEGGGEGRGEKREEESSALFSLHPTPLLMAVMQAINTEFKTPVFILFCVYNFS